MVLAGSLVAQTDWPIYGHDPGAMRYSLLKQINTKNVARIQLAWAFDTEAPITEAPGTQATAREPAGDSGGHAQPAAAAARPVVRRLEARPLVIGGVMYLSTGYNRVVAMEPKTGKKIWEYESAHSPAVRIANPRSAFFPKNGVLRTPMLSPQAGRRKPTSPPPL